MVQLKGRGFPKPPAGRGNRAALDQDDVRRFALEALAYLQELERRFDVAIKTIALDCPRSPKENGAVRRAADSAMDTLRISCITTPSSIEFAIIRDKASQFLCAGGAESRIPHANQLWMLIGFELFAVLAGRYDCREVFPQAIAVMLGSADDHKSTSDGYRAQLVAAAQATGYAAEELDRSLNASVFGSRHDRLDAFMCAWIASLEREDLEPHGVPPWDVIWLPRLEKPPNQRFHRAAGSAGSR